MPAIAERECVLIPGEAWYLPFEPILVPTELPDGLSALIDDLDPDYCLDGHAQEFDFWNTKMLESGLVVPTIVWFRTKMTAKDIEAILPAHNLKSANANTAAAFLKANRDHRAIGRVFTSLAAIVVPKKDEPRVMTVNAHRVTAPPKIMKFSAGHGFLATAQL